jgi:hypothetical protein
MLLALGAVPGCCGDDGAWTSTDARAELRAVAPGTARLVASAGAATVALTLSVVAE